jgi:hypothetical protein
MAFLIVAKNIKTAVQKAKKQMSQLSGYRSPSLNSLQKMVDEGSEPVARAPDPSITITDEAYIYPAYPPEIHHAVSFTRATSRMDNDGFFISVNQVRLDESQESDDPDPSEREVG